MGLIINKRYNSNGDVPFKGGWVKGFGTRRNNDQDKR